MVTPLVSEAITRFRPLVSAVVTSTRELYRRTETFASGLDSTSKSCDLIRTGPSDSNHAKPSVSPPEFSPSPTLKRIDPCEGPSALMHEQCGQSPSQPQGQYRSGSSMSWSHAQTT